MATLSYPPFKANSTIVDVANGRTTMKRGSQGEAVRLVQKALLELGFAMQSGADGSFGGQTHTAVIQFQNKWGLTPDGIVGRDTIGVLDVDIAIHHGIIQPPPPVIEGIQNISFWINAFIPDPSISPDVKPAPGASAGKSMITVPFPNTNLKRCFLGDHRSYSNNPLASARIHAQVNFIDLDKPNPVMQTQPRDIICGESIEIDPISGVIIGQKTASTSRCRFFNLRVGPAPATNPSASSIQLDFVAAANLPLMDGSPDIDFNGVLSIDRERKFVRFSGLVDGFPCFEAWVSINGREPQNLFKMAPIAPFYIIGEANRSVDGIVQWI